MSFLSEPVFDYKATDAFIKNAIIKKNYLAVGLKDTNQVIGHLYFERQQPQTTIEIGWIFLKNVHGKGFALESVTSLLNWLFQQGDVHVVTAYCQVENRASWRLMEKLGMSRIELLHDNCMGFDGTYRDEYCYSISVSEWDEFSKLV